MHVLTSGSLDTPEIAARRSRNLTASTKPSRDSGEPGGATPRFRSTYSQPCPEMPLATDDGMGVPRTVMFLSSYCRYTSWKSPYASRRRSAPAGRIGQIVKTHRSLVADCGDMRTRPSGYAVAVHDGGIVYTYSFTVAGYGAFCGYAPELCRTTHTATPSALRKRRATMSVLLERESRTT